MALAVLLIELIELQNLRKKPPLSQYLALTLSIQLLALVVDPFFVVVNTGNIIKSP